MYTTNYRNAINRSDGLSIAKEPNWYSILSVASHLVIALGRLTS